MLRPPRLRIAPLLDLVCITSFVLVGGREHGLDQDLGWFLGVMWPLCVGFFGAALLTRLYRRAPASWAVLTATWLLGVAVAQVLRGAFTDDSWFGTFTVVLAVYLGLTMFGWRVVAALVTRHDRALSRVD